MGEGTLGRIRLVTGDNCPDRLSLTLICEYARFDELLFGLFFLKCSGAETRMSKDLSSNVLFLNRLAVEGLYQYIVQQIVSYLLSMITRSQELATRGVLREASEKKIETNVRRRKRKDLLRIQIIRLIEVGY